MSKINLLRDNISITQLEANIDNPNVMTDKAFNMLVDNIRRMGITDPILVREISNEDFAINCKKAAPQKAEKAGGSPMASTKNTSLNAPPKTYRIVGGHHRVEAAKQLGYQEVPCTIITGENFTKDEEAFQLMRHNIIKGKLSPEKFRKLYEGLQSTYSQETLIEAFGFDDGAELKKLIKATEKSLPKELKTKFKEAATQIKTMDGLADVVNSLYAMHGDSLPHGYMSFDFGGQESVWLRMRKKDLINFQEVAQLCVDSNKTLDSLMRAILQSIAEKTLPGLSEMLDNLPTVAMPSPAPDMPTEDMLSEALSEYLS